MLLLKVSVVGVIRTELLIETYSIVPVYVTVRSSEVRRASCYLITACYSEFLIRSLSIRLGSIEEVES